MSCVSYLVQFQRLLLFRKRQDATSKEASEVVAPGLFLSPSGTLTGLFQGQDKANAVLHPDAVLSLASPKGRDCTCIIFSLSILLFPTSHISTLSQKKKVSPSLNSLQTPPLSSVHTSTSKLLELPPLGPWGVVPEPGAQMNSADAEKRGWSREDAQGQAYTLVA